ncbi:MAG TPA: tetratricopeptide repeat protein [Xanthobacteraceae bacterium]|nr:tetratricopeptide repeat protein [Xanthobacteraceae bacterium]
MAQAQVDQTSMPLGEALAYAERCRNEGKLIEAEAVCRQILQAQPNIAEAHHLFGVIAHQNGKLSEAIDHVTRAIKVAPKVALFHANLGEMLRLAGRPKRAVEEARAALEIDPKMAAALSNLGVALYELKEYEDAAQAQRKAIEAKPDFAEAHSNLGNALHAMRRFNEAVPAYRRAIEINPNYADGWANLGTTLHHSGSFEEGISALRRAIALAPHHANAHSGLGILLLMRGDFAEGWEEYEWRLRSTERKGPKFPEVPWQGESLAGKHIYVQAEQGFGDTLQFARYMPLLTARGAKVILRVHQQLVTLIRENFPDITVLGDRGTPAPYQYDAVLLSLPRLLKTRLETIPAQVPYLRAPAEAALRWKGRLGKLKGLRVGIVWAGNPEHVNDSRRSIDLSKFAPLFAVRGASFASLQFGSRAADVKNLKRAKPAIEDLSREIAGFSEPAAAIEALDLVISIDSSTAHLAGALGKPVWVLLPWVTDWRWLHDREDNPWYPTMRLFRQKKGQDWSEVFARVEKELIAVVQGDTVRLTPFKADGERRAAEAAAIIAAETAQAARPKPPPVQTATPGQALILAEQKRRHGFLADADELVRRAITAEPDNAEAWHMLGIIAHQSGKTADAIEHLRRAITIKPDVALYHANVGEMCRLAGRVDDAIAAGRRAIELNPNYPGALSNLGIALFDQGDFDEALELYDRAIALEGAFAQAYSNRGNALQRLKRFAEAEKDYRRAIELQPSFADAWNNLGTCLRELKRSEEAEAVYRKALEFAPNNPDTLDNLALALKDLERLDEAAELMRRAITVESRDEKLFVHYATVLLDQHKTEEAGAANDRALALNANNHDAVNLAGRIAFDRGDLAAALAHYRRALTLKPDLADAYNNMGNVLKELGQLTQAHDAYLQAIAIDPEIPGVYVNLADSKKFTPGDPHLEMMQTLAAKPEGLSHTDRLQLDFALGKAYGDLKDYRRSFERLLAGNAAKRATITYDEAAVFGLFDRIEAVFTRELIAKKSGGDPSHMPIFVIGMPRSGTTLIEQIVASHPMVHGAGELQTFNDVILDVRASDGQSIPYPNFVPALEAQALRQIGGRYVAEVRKLAPTGERVTDKMPSNYYFAGLIHLALPNAKIIHSIRNPVDTCISCFSKLFTAEQNHTYDLAELGRYYGRYERLMAHWHRVLPPQSILDVRYEDVVADLEGQARRILAYCGLPWDERCLSFHETERPVRTASATQVRQPIYQSAVGRWRVYQEQLEPLLSALGMSAAQRA